MKNTFILLIFSVFLLNCNSVGEKNYYNLMKIKEGMKISEVDSIMGGKPKLMEPAFWNDSLFVQYYVAPTGASDDLGVVFNKDGTVVEIKYGD